MGWEMALSCPTQLVELPKACGTFVWVWKAQDCSMRQAHIPSALVGSLPSVKECILLLPKDCSDPCLLAAPGLCYNAWAATSATLPGAALTHPARKAFQRRSTVVAAMDGCPWESCARGTYEIQAGFRFQGVGLMATALPPESKDLGFLPGFATDLGQVIYLLFPCPPFVHMDSKLSAAGSVSFTCIRCAQQPRAKVL